MAKFPANIWGNALGSIGSITFSLARDRSGKIQTARERVDPVNPSTPDQVAARTNMKDSSQIAQRLKSLGVVSVFDRSVSELPAFQSVISIFQNCKKGISGQISFTNVPPSVGRGIGSRIRVTSIVYESSFEVSVNFVIDGPDLPSGYQVDCLAFTNDVPFSDIGLDRMSFGQTFSTTGGTVSFGFDGGVGDISEAFLCLYAHPFGEYSPSSTTQISFHTNYL